ncbi:MAG TPA: M3 family oligoendopeptidase [Gemmatimonadales bacterium]|nr:M3 family oligoendopeptidase [Gemmatimonadales bacterium]
MTLFRELPASSAGFADATWSDIEPYYVTLAEAPLGAGDIEPWLASWSRLEELVTEAAGLAMIAYTGDTTDAGKQAAHLRFSTDIYPKLEEQSVGLVRRLLATGWSRPDLETTIRRFRTAVDIFREENVEVFAELEHLSSRYHEITGGMTAMWDGKEVPVPQLSPHLKNPDRAIRERAFHGITAPYLASHEALATLFDEMYALRQKAAIQAGFPDFEAFSFAAKCRYDYSPADCRAFHRAVESEVVPVVQRIRESRRQLLGVPVLKPWDLAVDPHLRSPVRPFADGRELSEKAARIFDRLDPVLGRNFKTMIDEQLLDLDSRLGKAPGGYCETLASRGRPFIFMNAVGVMDDVMTLLHEAGHAFHSFAAHAQPFIWQRQPGSEAAELASMSMELLAAPYLSDPGELLTQDELRLARLEHLEDILTTLLHVASVDAFQSWIYTSGRGHDAQARDEAWVTIRQRFDPGVDWSDLERERIARWYRQIHIFAYPFYYIEYGIAQLGALQVWWRSLENAAETLAQYRDALALGATQSLPTLYGRAGARLIFDAGEMRTLVRFVEGEIERLAAESGRST